jgi:hypothetical protein
VHLTSRKVITAVCSCWVINIGLAMIDNVSRTRLHRSLINVVNRKSAVSFRFQTWAEWNITHAKLLSQSILFLFYSVVPSTSAYLEILGNMGSQDMTMSKDSPVKRAALLLPFETSLSWGFDTQMHFYTVVVYISDRFCKNLMPFNAISSSIYKKGKGTH